MYNNAPTAYKWKKTINEYYITFFVLQIIAFFITQGVSTRKILVQTSGVILHINTRKKIYIKINSHFSRHSSHIAPNTTL